MTKRSDDDDPLAREIREIIKLLTHHDRMCAWGGCTAQMPWPVDPPRGWVLTITGKFDGRTVVLCPKHARELDDLLKGIGGALGDIMGSA